MIPGVPVNEMDLFVDPALCIRCFQPVRHSLVDDSAVRIQCTNPQCGHEAFERFGGSNNAALQGIQMRSQRSRREWEGR